MTRQQGAALIGTLAIGFAVVLLVGQALITIGRLSSAATAAEETARYAATWAARNGNAADAAEIAAQLAPKARVSAEGDATGIAVIVEIDVPLVGPEGSPLSRTVVGRAEVPIAEFRSRR